MRQQCLYSAVQLRGRPCEDVLQVGPGLVPWSLVDCSRLITTAALSPCKQISAVLRSARIDFVKWDMNRDFTHAAGADGRMGVRAHVLGLYVLLAQQR